MPPPGFPPFTFPPTSAEEVEAAGAGSLEVSVEGGQEQAGEEDPDKEEKNPTPKAKKEEDAEEEEKSPTPKAKKDKKAKKKSKKQRLSRSRSRQRRRDSSSHSISEGTAARLVAGLLRRVRR